MATEPMPGAARTQVPFVEGPISHPHDLLRNGDRMSREEFHQLYEQTPDDFKAELIGGIVYVASPVSQAHGKPDRLLSSLLAAYEARTPGVDGSQNTTVFLGNKDEPQPDQYLRILPECGGQSATEKRGYVEGAPELVAEIAYSSRAVDLHAKKRRYARCGVREYFVVCVKERQLQSFDLTAGKESECDAEGIYRSHVFPGLWINGPALLALDYAAVMKTLEDGLASPEHTGFVKHLALRRSS